MHDFRGFSGQIAGGIVRVGQPVMVLPSGFSSTVKQIWTLDGPLEEAFSPQSVTLVLEHDIDISRGDVSSIRPICPARVLSCTRASAGCIRVRCRPDRKYFLKHATQTVQAVVTSHRAPHRRRTRSIQNRVRPKLAMNDLGEIRLRTSKPLVYDGYATNRLTGSFILIEQGTNATVGAGMLYAPIEVARPEYRDFAI